MLGFIKSHFDLINMFPTEESCIEYLEQIRWREIPVSPFDPTAKVYTCRNGKYICGITRKYFNVLTGTMYENTKLELRKWFYAIWLITSHKKGISSAQLSKNLGVTQKTAWFLLQRIRACFGIENHNEIDGIVEADETFVGGKNKNRHKNKKVVNSQGRSYKDKYVVMGLLQRNGKLTCEVIPNTKKKTLNDTVNKYVVQGSILFTDEWKGYNGLDGDFIHFCVDHSKRNYAKDEQKYINSNSIESVWGLLKRAIIGTYNWVSKKHLQKYVDEIVYRYNTRDLADSDKFNWLLFNCGIRTPYKSLING